MSATNIYDIYKDTTSHSARSVEYKDILNKVQSYCAKHHSGSVLSGSNDDLSQLHEIISSFLVENNLSCDGFDTETLTSRLLSDMAGYSFLAKYIEDTTIEEININAYDDIEIVRSGGKLERVPEQFINPTQALDVIRRMLSKCGMVIDDTLPSVIGYLEKNIRISVDKIPIVDEDVGITASIRRVNQVDITRERLLETGTATPEMLDFLEACVKHGVSICFAGATNSGKTTLMAWLLSQIPNDYRLITIEEGSREFNCKKRDESGNILNSVVHLLTKPSTDPNLNIDQDTLLERTLRKNPDVIGVGEMRSFEAMTAAEAACTGHTVITTIHSKSAKHTFKRMMTLAKKKHSRMTDETLMDIMVEAFPVVVYVDLLKDGSRKIVEIIEALKYEDKMVKANTLWKYDIKENKFENGKYIVDGEFKKETIISEDLQNTLISNGISREELKLVIKEE
jgi:pilus assembly protein CpaF